MRSKGLLVVGAISILALPGLVYGLLHRAREADRRAAGERALAAARATERPRAPAPKDGDAGHVALGESLFRVHCFSCHGLGADGRGPSAASLYPAPRDLTDPAFLNSVTDDHLAAVVAEGGRAASRSVLMPPFADRFDAFEVRAIVGFLRSRALSVEDVLPGLRAPFVARETVLRDEVPPGGTREVTFFESSLLDGPPARVLFAGDVAIATDADGTLLGARALAGRTPSADEIAIAVRRLAAAVASHAEDVAEAARIRADYAADKDALGRDRRIYFENCASCHGPAGRPVEDDPAQRTHRPPNLANGAHLNRLSDDWLRELIRRGGGPLRVSETMPSYGGVLSAEEIDAIVRHARSLAVPPHGEARTP